MTAHRPLWRKNNLTPCPETVDHYKETFTNGSLSGEGNLRDGKRHGKWTWYYKSGGLKAEGKYKDGELEGYWEWWRENGNPLQAGSAAVLLAFCCWWLPDPLELVPFVEGIFSIALHYSGWVFGLAVFSAAIPIIAMAWVAYRTRSQGVLAVGLYFLTLYLLSPLEVTPVPLLGFGAGPLLGYFIVASQITFRSGDVDG